MERPTGPISSPKSGEPCWPLRPQGRAILGFKDPKKELGWTRSFKSEVLGQQWLFGEVKTLGTTMVGQEF